MTAVTETERDRKRWLDRLLHKTTQETGQRPQAYGGESSSRIPDGRRGERQLSALKIDIHNLCILLQHPLLEIETEVYSEAKRKLRER